MPSGCADAEVIEVPLIELELPPDRVQRGAYRGLLVLVLELAVRSGDLAAKDRRINKCRLSLRESDVTFARRKAT